MPFAPFHELCPDVAQRETRTIIVPPTAKLGPLTGEYHFIEMFCDEPNCDCRRVFFSVASSQSNQIEAVIAWGWEDLAFYKRWMGDDDPELAREMQGPNLNLGSPQSANAPALLDLAKRVLFVDPAYVERIKRHYTLFRSKVDGPVKKHRKSSQKKRGRR